MIKYFDLSPFSLDHDHRLLQLRVSSKWKSLEESSFHSQVTLQPKFPAQPPKPPPPLEGEEKELEEEGEAPKSVPSDVTVNEETVLSEEDKNPPISVTSVVQ